MYIYIRIGSKRIAGTLCPAFIHKNIRYTIFRCKINVILISIQVISGNKINIRSIRTSIVPPFPTHLPRLNPGRIPDYTFRSQPEGHRVFDQLFVIFGDHKITPGETSFSGSLSNIISFLQQFEATVTIFSKFQRFVRKGRNKTVLSIAFKEHTGIIRKVGF